MSSSRIPNETARRTEHSLIRTPDEALRFEGLSSAPPEVVYDVLADLESHLEWAGARQAETTRLLSLDAPPGPAVVGTEFRTTGSDGKVARFTDRSVVTEATRPEVFEFVTESVRHSRPGKSPWQSTQVHRYRIEPAGSGSRVSYTEEITRMVGWPRILRTNVIRRLLYRISAKYMRRGFTALIALAEERSGTVGEPSAEEGAPRSSSRR